MAKYFKVIRTNWKKSIFGTVALVYGYNYAYEKYQTNQLMRALCEEAARYGELPVPPTMKPRSVTVILNPAANRRKAKANFEKYCAPLLHLAGFTVDILMTESEGQARSLAANLKNPDMVVVGGGDGTLSEIVTGLMRAHGRVGVPLGVLPLGRTNSVALSLLGSNHQEGVAGPAELASATMAVVRGHTKHIDAVRVDVMEEEVVPPKPVYGLSGIKWGAFRDALSRQDSYWYFGIFRPYAAILFNSFSNSRNPVSAHVTFTQACEGCSRCYESRQDLHLPQTFRWYHYLIPSFTKKIQDVPQKNYKQVINTQCGILSELDITSLDINITCPCVCKVSKGVQVSLGPPNLNWWEWVNEGWHRVQGESPSLSPVVDAQNLEITPLPKSHSQETKETWFSIDSEEYEVRPVKITLIPKSVQVFFNEQTHTSYSLLERALMGC